MDSVYGGGPQNIHPPTAFGNTTVFSHDGRLNRCVVKKTMTGWMCRRSRQADRRLRGQSAQCARKARVMTRKTPCDAAQAAGPAQRAPRTPTARTASRTVAPHHAAGWSASRPYRVPACGRSPTDRTWSDFTWLAPQRPMVRFTICLQSLSYGLKIIRRKQKHSEKVFLQETR